MQAIILAGGKGSRLKPFTKVIPKPLIPIADDLSILEVVLKQLKYYGFTDITLAVNHMSGLLMAFFNNGEKLGLNISYSKESEPLGTAGPIKLVENLEDNFIVMNGDLLTTIDYKDLYNHHIESEADISISIYKKEVKIDLGVLKFDEEYELLDYIEKPTYTFDVSMGIYVIKKSIVELIPENEFFTLPDLVLKAKAQNKKVIAYKNDYYWLDIGRVNDYEQAIEIFQKKRNLFLKDDN